MKVLARLLQRMRAWVSGAPGWVGGVLAGLQAALFSLAVILLPLWAAAASAPSDASAGPDWSGASTAAARLWLLGFGVPWEIDGVTVSIPPLGVTALAGLMTVALSRRFADKTWTSWLLTVAAFTAVVVGMTSMVSAPPGESGGRALAAGVIAVLVAGPSAALGIWRAHGATLAWLGSLPHAVRSGMRLGAATVGAQVALAAAFGAAWTVAGRHAIAEIATGLAPDAVGGVTLAALETLFTPTLVAWYMAWDVGVGFSVGLAHFAPGQLVVAPLPQIPLLGALPTAAGGLLSWVPAVVIAVVVAIRLAMRARMPHGVQRLAAGALSVGLVGMSAAILGWFTSGALGPGTLQTAGTEWRAFAVVSAALAAGGLVLAELVEAGMRFIGIGVVATARPSPRSAEQRRDSRQATSSSARTPDDDDWLS
jgi:hypothetical protein